MLPATRILLILTALLTLTTSCGTNPTTEKKAASESQPVLVQSEQPANPETAAPAPKQPEHPKQTSDRPDPAPATAARSSHFSLDTGRQARLSLQEGNSSSAKAEALPLPTARSKSKKPGPPGYIPKNNVLLLAEPKSTAATVATLNQYETVYILDKIFTDEQGQESEYPTWYNIERENKQRGWVKGGSVAFGG